MRLKTPAVLCLCGTLVTAMTTPLATPINLPLGSNMGYGGASSHHTVFSTMNNPAVAATWEAKEPWRFGAGAGFGAGFEMGSFNIQSFKDASTNISNRMETIQKTATSLDLSTFTTQLELLKGDINSGLATVGDNFYVIASMEGIRAHSALERFEFSDPQFSELIKGISPTIPITYSHKKWGTFSYSTHSSSVLKTRMNGGKINFAIDNITNMLFTISNGGQDAVIEKIMDTATITTALDLSLAEVHEQTFSYSRRIIPLKQWGVLYGGLRVRSISTQLGTQTIALTPILKKLVNSAAEGGGDSTTDYLSEQFNKLPTGAQSSSGISMDLGVLWLYDYLSVGVTAHNINQPAFAYNSVPDCDTEEGKEEPLNCIAMYTSATPTTAYFVMNMQPRVEAAIFTPNRHWTWNLAFDFVQTKDPLGTPKQWLSSSISYASDASTKNWWWKWAVPDVRLGYRSNIASNGISMMTLGMTLFSFVNVDVAMDANAFSPDVLNRIMTQSDNMPRAFAANIGVETYF